MFKGPAAVIAIVVAAAQPILPMNNPSRLVVPLSIVGIASLAVALTLASCKDGGRKTAAFQIGTPPALAPAPAFSPEGASPSYVAKRGGLVRRAEELGAKLTSLVETAPSDGGKGAPELVAAGEELVKEVEAAAAEAPNPEEKKWWQTVLEWLGKVLEILFWIMRIFGEGGGGSESTGPGGIESWSAQPVDDLNVNQGFVTVGDNRVAASPAGLHLVEKGNLANAKLLKLPSGVSIDKRQVASVAKSGADGWEVVFGEGEAKMQMVWPAADAVGRVVAGR